jgi:hypothetical protein
LSACFSTGIFLDRIQREGGKVANPQNGLITARLPIDKRHADADDLQAYATPVWAKPIQ